jgi:surfactin synthase thioesterase subunit
MSESGTTPTALWLPALRRGTAAQARLFCFPFAGGSPTTFATWPERLPGVDVRPVHLPGRGNRRHEPAFHDVEAIVRALGPALVPLLDRPFAFFGHSMGAVLAFEVARYLRRHRFRQPMHLFVSGHRAPHIPDDTGPLPDVTDAALMAWLRAKGGTPPEVLQEPGLMALVLPVLRADRSVCASYVHAPESPLACAITVFGGVDDEESAPGFLEAWRTHTVRGTRLKKFPGGHFFLHAYAGALLAEIGATLSAATMARVYG